ncbi:MAG: hypothetical protein LLG06_01240 [Desulfobacteraceae bacterium]|nr:hypothetical protein [Desulfobacteraceae bacterium]
MTALSSDRKTQYMEGVEIPFLVGATKKIYAGSLVCLDGTTRLAEAGSDASGKIFAGVAMGQADNSAGLGSAISVRLRQRGRRDHGHPAGERRSPEAWAGWRRLVENAEDGRGVRSRALPGLGPRDFSGLGGHDHAQDNQNRHGV